MKKEPTRTKQLREQYRRHLNSIITRFYKNSKRKIMIIIENNTISLSKTLKDVKKTMLAVMDDIENVIDTEIAIVDNEAPDVIKKDITLAYKRGQIKAGYDLEKYGFTISPSLTPLDFEALNILEKNNFSLVKNVSLDMKKEMLRIASDGILRGESIYKISKNMDKTLGLGRNRCTKIARTEIIRAYAKGSMNTYRKAGIKKYQWITAWDERTCPECADLDGKVFPIGGHPEPPIHPCCRCSIAPYVE